MRATGERATRRREQASPERSERENARAGKDTLHGRRSCERYRQARSAASAASDPSAGSGASSDRGGEAAIGAEAPAERCQRARGPRGGEMRRAQQPTTGPVENRISPEGSADSGAKGRSGCTGPARAAPPAERAGFRRRGQPPRLCRRGYGGRRPPQRSEDRRRPDRTSRPSDSTRPRAPEAAASAAIEKTPRERGFFRTCGEDSAAAGGSTQSAGKAVFHSLSTTKPPKVSPWAACLAAEHLIHIIQPARGWGIDHGLSGGTHPVERWPIVTYPEPQPRQDRRQRPVLPRAIKRAIQEKKRRLMQFPVQIKRVYRSQSPRGALYHIMKPEGIIIGLFHGEFLFRNQSMSDRRGIAQRGGRTHRRLRDDIVSNNLVSQAGVTPDSIKTGRECGCWDPVFLAGQNEIVQFVLSKRTLTRCVSTTTRSRTPSTTVQNFCRRSGHSLHLRIIINHQGGVPGCYSAHG